MTRLDLARQIAERNDRCGHVTSDRICLRPKNHQGEHVLESVYQVVPFVNQ